MNDPVELSGGPKGGETVEGQGWAEGSIRQFGNAYYRRVGAQAVFVGEAG